MKLLDHTLQRLTLKQKVFLLQSLALVPWLVGVAYVVYHSWPEIRNMDREIAATRLLPRYFALMEAVQVHRGLSFTYLNLTQDSVDGKKIRGQIDQAEVLFDKELKKMKFLMRKEGILIFLMQCYITINTLIINRRLGL